VPAAGSQHKKAATLSLHIQTFEITLFLTYNIIFCRFLGHRAGENLCYDTQPNVIFWNNQKEKS